MLMMSESRSNPGQTLMIEMLECCLMRGRLGPASKWRLLSFWCCGGCGVSGEVLHVDSGKFGTRTRVGFCEKVYSTLKLGREGVPAK